MLVKSVSCMKSARDLLTRDSEDELWPVTAECSTCQERRMLVNFVMGEWTTCQ